MAMWNASKRRLMTANGTTYRYELQDVSEPNLLREAFPYDAVPKIIFDGVSEELDPAPEFYITDTTFRDGQQARPPYTVQQIVDLYTLLHRLGGPHGIIRQAEFFLYADADREDASLSATSFLRSLAGFER